MTLDEQFNAVLPLLDDVELDELERSLGRIGDAQRTLEIASLEFRGHLDLLREQKLTTE